MRTKLENPNHRAKLIRREEIAEDTYRLDFIFDKPFTAHPGQYAWVKLDRLHYEDPKGEQRAFSIVSTEEPNIIAIIFRTKMSGYKKTLLELPIDSEVSVIGPFGSFCALSDVAENNIVILGAGVGVAPFLSVLNCCFEGRENLRIHLIYCEKSESRIIPEILKIQEIAKNNPSFKVTIHIGDVDENFVQKYNIFERGATWHLSGPEAVINILTPQLLSIGVTRTQIRFEEYYPYFPYERKLSLPAGVQGSEKNVYKLALDDALTHTVITDINGRVLYANNAASEISGYTHDELLGNTPRLWGGLMDKSYYSEMWRMIKDDRLPFVGKVRNRKKSGEEYIAEISIAPIIEANGDLIGFYASEKNITELVRIDKAKTEFVSLVSHQLRTPLSSVNWFSEMLLSGDAGELNSEQRKYLEEIYMGNQRMVELVNDLLDVSRLDLGTFIITLVELDIIELAESVILEQVAHISEKKIEFIRAFSATIPKIPLDAKLMRMVLQNIVSNAVKYTSDNGRVVFSMDVIENKNLLIKISDTGCGIPKKDQGEIFAKLFRADNVKQMDVEGTGLGLYIVKSIVESSGGKIWFESEENKGTTFYVMFPLGGMKKLEIERSPF